MDSAVPASSHSAFDREQPALGGAGGRPWAEWEFWAVLLVAGAIYFARLTALPICGEESRWATVAREMIATGDWIVPRQQGQIFAERPPLGSWAMAVVGLVRGQVDAVAVRLPSALATVLLSAVVYAYGRIFLTRRGALCAALAYATLGQVLQIGRLGESEALFSLLLASALLAWHAGYVRGWSPALTWCLGYALAALAALVKGPQAPVYFVAVTGAFLLWQRQWRRLFCWQHALGLGTFAAIVACWQIPFYRATNAQTVIDVWSGLARDRFSFGGLLKHLVSYPLETLGCLLPWSPLLVGLIDPRVRRGWGAYRELLTFLLVALAITYPTVWLSAGARGRYYMPLYPCIALLMGMIVERCTAPGDATELARGWRRYLLAIGLTAAAGAVLIVAGNVVDLHLPFSLALSAGQFWPLLAIGGTAAGVLVALGAGRLASRPRLAVLALAALLGVAQTILFTSLKAQGANDITAEVAELRRNCRPGPSWSASVRSPTASPIFTASRSGNCPGPKT